ncbi:hypothetical protein C8J30_12511 [Rhodobacter viridis]|uniref:Uncharacterized protein n=1 Tax=Rhodobacter viridis TaxID=1054202 RepID=A0A318TX46_9RHOB|nr:hypothetical protein C8J30_12511 [Rhodobacter viridis]
MTRIEATLRGGLSASPRVKIAGPAAVPSVNWAGFEDCGEAEMGGAEPRNLVGLAQEAPRIASSAAPVLSLRQTVGHCPLDAGKLLRGNRRRPGSSAVLARRGAPRGASARPCDGRRHSAARIRGALQSCAIPVSVKPACAAFLCRRRPPGRVGSRSRACLQARATSGRVPTPQSAKRPSLSILTAAKPAAVRCSASERAVKPVRGRVPICPSACAARWP